MPKPATGPYDAVEHLETDEDMAAYLDCAPNPPVGGSSMKTGKKGRVGIIPITDTGSSPEQEEGDAPPVVRVLRGLLQRGLIGIAGLGVLISVTIACGGDGATDVDTPESMNEVAATQAQGLNQEVTPTNTGAPTERSGPTGKGESTEDAAPTEEETPTELLTPTAEREPAETPTSTEDPEPKEGAASTGAPAATEERAAGEKLSSLPSYDSLSLYSADSPLNQPIPEAAEIDPGSDQYIELFHSVVQDGGFVIELKQYSTTVFVADPDAPRVDVALHCGPQWAGVDTLAGVPIPTYAEPAQDADGASHPIQPGECGADAYQDNQMVVLDPANRCEYDFWQIRREKGGWAASWGNSISMDSRGIYEKGFSARGSGFTQLAGQIWPDELENGRISHALIFSYALTAAGGPVPPATETDGTSDHEWALPEGALLRLDPELDLDGLDLRPYEHTIAQALQEYGMYLVDTSGSGASVEAIDPRSVQGNPYEGLLPDEDYPSIANIPADRFQVMQLPPQDAGYDEKSELVASGCASFR